MGNLPYVAQIFERNPTTVKNYGIWVRYQSRTGYHNAYKEYRDTTLNGAVEQMYQEMASRHRVRSPCIQIIKTATITASQVRGVPRPRGSQQRAHGRITRGGASPASASNNESALCAASLPTGSHGSFARCR
jgi:large subunit ribosomal protein L18Ae